jgi:hypothetical protein
MSAAARHIAVPGILPYLFGATGRVPRLSRRPVLQLDAEAKPQPHPAPGQEDMDFHPCPPSKAAGDPPLRRSHS